MKKIYTVPVFLFSFFPSLLKADYWTQKAAYGGGTITNAIGFSFASTAYIGLGIDDLSNYRSDFWQYDQPSNTWTQKANFPGQMRQGATAFSIGATGYIGLGWTPGYANDFWKYEPSTNTWTQLINFAGTPRDFASAFTINNKGYFTCGLDSIGPASDLWEYDDVLNSWTQKASLATGVFAAAAFVVNNKGYVTSGYGTLSNSEYDPLNNSWTVKNPFPFLLVGAAGFGIGNYGYVGTGIINLTSNTSTKQLWQYHFSTDSWTQKTDFGGDARTGAIGFTIGGKGYIGTGNSSAGFYSDFWEYTPDPVGTEEFNVSALGGFDVYPNPAKEELFVNGYSLMDEEKIEIIITDTKGKRVYQINLDTRYSILDTKIDIRQFSNGLYFIQLNTGKEMLVKKFLKE